jgi:hypothetical protein
MSGQRSKSIADFVSPRAAYRQDLTAADAVTAINAGIPVLDTRGAPNQQLGLGIGGDTNIYGRNAQINVALIVKGFSSVTVELWQLAAVEIQQLGEASVPATTNQVPAATLEWVFVATNTVTRSSNWTIKDIPPGQYKILLTAVSGAGYLNIREQHAQ